MTKTSSTEPLCLSRSLHTPFHSHYVDVLHAALSSCRYAAGLRAAATPGNANGLVACNARDPNASSHALIASSSSSRTASAAAKDPASPSRAQSITSGCRRRLRAAPLVPSAASRLSAMARSDSALEVGAPERDVPSSARTPASSPHCTTPSAWSASSTSAVSASPPPPPPPPLLPTPPPPPPPPRSTPPTP